MKDKKNYLTCEKVECFGCEEGHCIVLTDNSFKKECPFFKTREQAAKERAYCKARMDEIRIKCKEEILC